MVIENCKICPQFSNCKYDACNIRPNMGYVLVEQSENGEGLRGVTTDGYRLHIVDPFCGYAAKEGMAPGFYKILKTGTKRSKSVWAARLDDSETGTINFPNYRKVMPEGEAVNKTTFEGFIFGLSSVSELSISKALFKFIRETPETFRLKYLTDLGIDNTWDVEWYGDKKPMKFTSTNYTAVIMPMREG